ncbi:MAG: Uma2 family endonuclease [Cyanobacteria bacterium J06621_11]
MVQAPKKPLTLKSFLSLPEAKPASEYIDGHVTQKPMPQTQHSALQQDLSAAINAVTRAKKVARAFPKLRCSFDNSAVVPDIAVLLWENIPRKEDGKLENKISIAPDWAVEILSPGQRSAKVIKKILHCLKHGTQMGWLIAPAEQSIFVYRPQKEIIVLDEPNEVLPVPEFMTPFTLTVEDLFSFLYE